MDPKRVAAVLDDPDRVPLEERLRAGLALAEAMTNRPGESYADEIAGARAAGLDDEAIEDAANVAFHFNYINRVSDALEFDLPKSDKVTVLARLLDRAKAASSKRRRSPSTITTDEGIVRPVEVQVGHEAVLGAVATVDPAQRIAVESFTARLRGGRRSELPVPEDLRGFLEKLARHAYKITDEDFEALRAAGYDKDALFEIIQAAAWGASIAALENILAELHGATRPEAAREREAG